MLVLAPLALLFLTPAASQEMVTVGFYGEALCPDCINFINGPLTMAFKEVSWCSLIRMGIVSDGCTLPCRFLISFASIMPPGVMPSL